MGSHSATCLSPDLTQANKPRLNPSYRQSGTRLPTPEGWKARVDLGDRYKHT